MRTRLIAALLALPIPAAGQTGPSFDCGNARTPTEFAICGDADLSRLDAIMAEMFFDEFDFLAPRRPDDARRLRADQTVWQRWRNTCDDDADCLVRRYRARIADFDPAFLFERDFAGDADGSTGVRVRDGLIERLMPDGTVQLFTPAGELVAIRFPNGATQVFHTARVEVGSDGPILPPPTPPAADDPWLADLETRLLSVVDGLLPPEDHTGYRALHDRFPTPTRVERHISSIGILSR